jgi:hypothetical protein
VFIAATIDRPLRHGQAVCADNLANRLAIRRAHAVAAAGRRAKNRVQLWRALV